MQTRFDTENEQPYIDSCKQDEIAEREAELKMERFWDMMTDEDGAAKLAAKHSDSYDVAGVLLSMIAKIRYDEKIHALDTYRGREVLKSERDADRASFVNHLFDAVEGLFKGAL